MKVFRDRFEIIPGIGFVRGSVTSLVVSVNVRVARQYWGGEIPDMLIGSETVD